MLGVCLIFIAGLSGYFLGKLSYSFILLTVSDESFFRFFLRLMYLRNKIKNKK